MDAKKILYVIWDYFLMHLVFSSFASLKYLLINEKSAGRLLAPKDRLGLYPAGSYESNLPAHIFN